MTDKTEVGHQFDRLRRMLLERGTTAVGWMGIEVAWERQAKRDGGTVKRNGSYGRFTYSYRDQSLTLEEAIAEVMKPASLRQALIEAQAVVECTMCSRVVVGREALDAFFNLSGKLRWSSTFQHLPEGYRRIVLCPRCLAGIVSGDYRKV